MSSRLGPDSNKGQNGHRNLCPWWLYLFLSVSLLPRFLSSSQSLLWLSLSRLFTTANGTLGRRVNETEAWRARWFIVWLSSENRVAEHRFRRMLLKLPDYSSFFFSTNLCPRLTQPYGLMSRVKLSRTKHFWQVDIVCVRVEYTFFI